MPLCGIISSESLGMLPAVWAKECENLLEVTVVTGCDTQLEQQAARGRNDWLETAQPRRWGAADTAHGVGWHGDSVGRAAYTRPRLLPRQGQVPGCGPTHPCQYSGLFQMRKLTRKLLKPNIASELINAKIKL